MSGGRAKRQDPHVNTRDTSTALTGLVSLIHWFSWRSQCIPLSCNLSRNHRELIGVVDSQRISECSSPRVRRLMCSGNEQIGSHCCSKHSRKTCDALVMDENDVLRLLGHLDPCGVAGLNLFISKRVRDLVTMVVTTSVIPIHPETRLLTEVIASHGRHEPELEECRKIVVCDFPKLSISGTKQFKSGKVLEEDMARYEEYISKLEDCARIGEAPFRNTIILRCQRYRGFAMAVHEALSLVTTPYVMVIQHDRMLERPFGIRQVLDIMQANRSMIKYVGLASSKSELQIHSMNSRYRIDLTPKLLILDNDPSESNEAFKKRLLSNSPTDIKRARRILAPLIFWYDSTHIASVEHYREFVFGEHRIENAGSYWNYFKLGTGDFIEDKLGQAEREDVKANGMSAHEKYGNYLLEDGLGPFVQHCHGRLIGTSSARTFEIYFGDKH